MGDLFFGGTSRSLGGLGDVPLAFSRRPRTSASHVGKGDSPKGGFLERMMWNGVGRYDPRPCANVSVEQKSLSGCQGTRPLGREQVDHVERGLKELRDAMRFL